MNNLFLLSDNDSKYFKRLINAIDKAALFAGIDLKREDPPFSAKAQDKFKDYMQKTKAVNIPAAVKRWEALSANKYFTLMIFESYKAVLGKKEDEPLSEDEYFMNFSLPIAGAKKRRYKKDLEIHYMLSDSPVDVGGILTTTPIREDSEAYNILKKDLQNSFLKDDEAIAKTRELLGLSEYLYLENYFYTAIPVYLNFAAEIIGEPKEKQSYRTVKKAAESGAITSIPRALAIPTLANFENTMSFYPKGNAYLHQLKSTDNLSFKDGHMYFDGNYMREVSEVELQNMKTKEGIESIDLPLLRMFYSLILYRFEQNGYRYIEDILEFPVPLLAQYMGLPTNIDNEHILNVISKAQRFHYIIGVFNSSKHKTPSIYPVLNFEGYNAELNTIRFGSPYLNFIIQKVYDAAIRKTKEGVPKCKKNGEPQRIATHSYLIDSSIISERNKAAAENVAIIVTLIEQAGNHTPNIKAKTLIERNVQLSERLKKTKNPGKLLKTTFIKTWELLKDKTALSENYKKLKVCTIPPGKLENLSAEKLDAMLLKNIDPKAAELIPTVKGLETLCFYFPNDGKSKKTSAF